MSITLSYQTNDNNMNQVSEEVKAAYIIKDIVNKEGVLSKEEKLKIISLSAYLQIILQEDIVYNETDKQLFIDSIKTVHNRLYS
jgi:hypothetical protein